mmetsp:Transcript_41425/g.133615  ORF Transcript_41425/g.133615 Transcript_41425/m.133615 type:complete len:227 (+) Transcript_41425:325-1005(+)
MKPDDNEVPHPSMQLRRAKERRSQLQLSCGRSAPSTSFATASNAWASSSCCSSLTSRVPSSSNAPASAGRAGCSQGAAIATGSGNFAPPSSARYWSNRAQMLPSNSESGDDNSSRIRIWMRAFQSCHRCFLPVFLLVQMVHGPPSMSEPIVANNSRCNSGCWSYFALMSLYMLSTFTASRSLRSFAAALCAACQQRMPKADSFSVGFFITFRIFSRIASSTNFRDW